MFVRTASERDLGAIRDLLVETWHATYDDIYGIERVNAITADWHSVETLKAQSLRPNSEFLVADDGKRLGGMAYAAAGSDPKVALLHQLYVRPENQGAGAGRALLAEIEECFPEAERLRLEVEAANGAAVAFYVANGFARIGETENCGTAHSGIPALVFEKILG